MSCEKHGYTNNVYCPACDLEQSTNMPAANVKRECNDKFLDDLSEMSYVQVTGAALQNLIADARLAAALLLECQVMREESKARLVALTEVRYTLGLIRNTVCGECAPLVIPMCDRALERSSAALAARSKT